ncbi:hypothetical protein CFK37_12825 [Virgibacillus phasianinus]|uniref:Type II secretion system protein n=1 Tax=Virgibacillus phasianinus TaxID=2017483 RepID=A0A220U4P6_9BACI|nr:hypothetical protein [Virgibacillus phasianinus]ASK62962.1 hypothetical protein CFK37_12825 [Virgibacillus phasianinus]
MNRLNNEHGAALVLTLFIVTIMLLFILTLSYQVINTTKQVTTVEKNMDAEHLAKMGVEYYYQWVKHEHVQSPSKNIEEIITALQGMTDKEIIIDQERRFLLMNAKIDGSNLIKITCKGIAFGNDVIETNEIKLVDH